MMNKNRIFILLSSFYLPLLLFSFCNIYAQQNQPLSAENITLYDPNLKIELVTSGLDFPTTMAFLGPNDFLILEKNTGNVKRFVNGTVLEKPLLHVKPSIKDERGLLGIAISEKKKDVYDNPFSIENYEDGEPVDGRAGILRLTQDGYPVLNANGTGILGNKYPLNAYYAYGIRNSFGIDFDPVTGKLWDTENGPQFGDEINMVEPGFNSGSDRVYGIWEADELGDRLKDKKGEYIVVGNNPANLVYFDGKGHYNPPEFIWVKTIAPTALLSLDSDKLGSNYKNDMFVGSADGGRI